MKAGVVGLIDGSLDDVSSFHNTFEKDGTEFTHSFQVRNTNHTTGGREVISGQAATQEVEDDTNIHIDPDTGDISVQDEPLKKGKYTDFVLVPDEFVAVGSGRGTFVFDILSYEHSVNGLNRSTIDLNEYAERYYTAENVDPWQVGFYGNVGNAEKGVVYGENVFSDDEIGEVLERSQLNQLGLQFERDGQIIKTTMSESGYVEIYQPSNFESEDYAEFILNDLTSFME
ncbi:hypothetical protein [Halorubrum sp. PV6]|uniref:hypothetical protein n=1 Tax=Halorubrum sp. PV6 TaxID=634157 RepID=UPI000F8CB24F|nr:hypothetical protein [Halorubrum sp. PV6]